MGTQARARGGDTRSRIEEVALQLFCDQGYEKTSLREIADQLQVTKAALYYHFKSKEDLLVSIVESAYQPVRELIEWGRAQPRTLETKREILRRYQESITVEGSLFRIFHENKAAIQELDIKEYARDRLFELTGLLCEDDCSLADRVRCTMALFSLHSSMFMLRDTNTPVEEQRAAGLEVAYELLDATELGRRARPAAVAEPAG